MSVLLFVPRRFLAAPHRKIWSFPLVFFIDTVFSGPISPQFLFHQMTVTTNNDFTFLLYSLSLPPPPSLKLPRPPNVTSTSAPSLHVRSRFETLSVLLKPLRFPFSHLQKIPLIKILIFLFLMRLVLFDDCPHGGHNNVPSVFFLWLCP